MINQIMLLYLKKHNEILPKTKIGLIIDSAQQHVACDLNCWLQTVNADNEYGSTIYVESIEKGLTAIHQTGDVMV